MTETVGPTRTSAAPALPALAQSTAAAVPDLSLPWQADPVPGARVLWLNEPLALELGLDPELLRTPAGLALLTGRLGPDGRPLPADAPAPATPFTTAQAYAGHQFGQANPQLGDGRAVLLGDLPDTHGARGARHDLHLKGSGRTPFARGGDGKAPLGPMLREAIVGEFLHATGVPTTRALAVLTTGEEVAPRRGSVPEPGALLVRAAASHLRVGTMEYAAWHHGPAVLQQLVDLAIARHHPQAAEAEVPALALLEAVTRAQAELVARWMQLGFVHGVMNTDNMALSGQSIDHGPCAFLDTQRRGAVYSSIDRGGRYAYGNQPGIALWNLSRLAEALLPLVDPEDPQRAVDAATAVLEGFEPAYLTARARLLGAALGVPRAEEPARQRALLALGDELDTLLEAQGMDRTLSLRRLAEGEEDLRAPDPGPLRDWHARLLALRGDGEEARAAMASMARTNPRLIPRNRHLETALAAAHAGDTGPALRILEAVRSPFTSRREYVDIEDPGDDGDLVMTFCGT